MATLLASLSKPCMHSDEDRLWTISEAAEFLQVPISAIYKMTGPKAGVRIPHVRLAGRLRFRKGDLDEWLELLSVSNLEVLRKTKTLSRKVRHGVDPQEKDAQR